MLRMKILALMMHFELKGCFEPERRHDNVDRTKAAFYVRHNWPVNLESSRHSVKM